MRRLIIPVNVRKAVVERAILTLHQDSPEELQDIVEVFFSPIMLGLQA